VYGYIRSKAQQSSVERRFGLTDDPSDGERPLCFGSAQSLEHTFGEVDRAWGTASRTLVCACAGGGLSIFLVGDGDSLTAQRATGVSLGLQSDNHCRIGMYSATSTCDAILEEVSSHPIPGSASSIPSTAFGRRVRLMRR